MVIISSSNLKNVYPSPSIALLHCISDNQQMSLFRQYGIWIQLSQHTIIANSAEITLATQPSYRIENFAKKWGMPNQPHSGLLVRTFKIATHKEERKGRWEPSFAANLTLNFRALIQPYSSGLLEKKLWRRLSLKPSIKIRMSEDVRTSKKVKVWLYLLPATCPSAITKTRKNRRCGGRQDLRNVFLCSLIQIRCEQSTTF